MLFRFALLFSIIAGGFITYLMVSLATDAWPTLRTGEILQPGYWDFRSESYKALAMVYGTATVSVIALLLALPIGMGAAIYVSEFLTGKKRAAVKIAIEMLAGIPSVVYGLLGVAVLLPLLGPLIMEWGGVSGDSLLAAGCLLSIMILPTMMTFADDALRCVPLSMREEGLGLGLSKVQVIFFVVLPRAKTGIIGAVMLAWGRALGETIAVYLVIGRTDQPFGMATLSFDSLLKSGQTLTTKLGGSELAIAYGDPAHWQALMALGMCLWVAVGLLSFVSERLWGANS